jgi:hypothetical protein
MQPVTNFAPQVTAINSVIGLQVTDDGFNGVTALDEFALRSAQSLCLTAMDGRQVRVVAIHTSVAKVDDGRAWFLARVLHENRGLLDLGARALIHQFC